jgi:transposase
MDSTTVIESVRSKYQSLRSFLTERTRRLWAATEAREIGWGGVTLVEQATGISQKTIRKGLQELQGDSSNNLPADRSRKSGAGRKKVTDNDKQLREALETLIDPVTRGDPESPLRWTCKSTRRLADELTGQGHSVGPTAVRFLLHELEYSLQANRKTREGIDHPDRNEQFLYINEHVKKYLDANQPAISVDTKKKEKIGDFSNVGKEYCKKGKPTETRTHDFVDKVLGKAIPYGVYDIESNEGWVNIGINYDTALFAANSIRRWWAEMGHHRFPKATQILITADAGGSNGPRTRLWKTALQQLANDLGLDVTVCHFPPGTSKWNKIEHRLFSFITQNWRGKPLYDLQTVVNLIGSTTTRQGLSVRCAVDDTIYKKGIVVSDSELAAVKLCPHAFHGEWNYTVKKRTIK